MTDILNHHVLVLNKNWVVIGTTTVKDAVVLMSRDSARAICTSSFVMYDWDQWVSEETNLPNVPYKIRTPSLQIPAPTVIILNKYDDIHKTTVKFSSRGVYRRDDYTCQYCNVRKKTEDLSIDHVIPRSRNGKTSWENCVTACFRCNNKKSDRTPQEAGLKLAKRPVRPSWNPVFHVRADKRPSEWQPLLKGSW